MSSQVTQCYGGFGRFCRYANAITRVTHDAAAEEMRIMPKSGLSALTLRSFIDRWSKELTQYYDVDFGSTFTGLQPLDDCPGSFVKGYEQSKQIDDCEFGDTVVFVLADLATNIDPTWVPPHIQKRCKRAGKLRRKKLRHQWAYENPMNRIHGFLVMKEVTNEHHKKVTMCIDTICSTYFTTKKGIGSDLMELAKDFSKEVGAFDIVLEVANEFSANGFTTEDMEIDSDTEDESDDEDDEGGDDEGGNDEGGNDEGGDGDDEDDEDEDDDDEDDDDEDDEIWYPDDDAMNILSEELWKKCMRRGDNGQNVYYNLDQEYIEAGLWNYLHCAHETEDTSELWKGTEKRIIADKDDPQDTEYGGYWYLKGRRSQEKLMKFYEMFGFKEDPQVHTDWCMFSVIPYPTMRLSLE